MGKLLLTAHQPMKSVSQDMTVNFVKTFMIHESFHESWRFLIHCFNFQNSILKFNFNWVLIKKLLECIFLSDILNGKIKVKNNIFSLENKFYLVSSLISNWNNHVVTFLYVTTRIRQRKTNSFINKIVMNK